MILLPKHMDICKTTLFVMAPMDFNPFESTSLVPDFSYFGGSALIFCVMSQIT
jgi:hypothetical protein